MTDTRGLVDRPRGQPRLDRWQRCLRFHVQPCGIGGSSCWARCLYRHAALRVDRTPGIGAVAEQCLDEEKHGPEDRELHPPPLAETASRCIDFLVERFGPSPRWDRELSR
jgi:hypothetical protein